MRRDGAARGTLYVVGTPIGNLDDLSPRAIAALGESRVVACEDTRRTRGLLARRGLRARLVSYHRLNESRRAAELVAILREGGSVALVSDGGTPGISDPGAELVRRAHDEGHRVVPVPGPSAVTALVSASGFPPGPFTFVGFPAHRQAVRRRQLEALRHEPRPLLFFESPLRLRATLMDAIEILGDRTAFLGREMTKIHEEFLRGTLREIVEALGPRAVKGEVAFLVSGADAAGAPPNAGSGGAAPEESIAAAVRRLVAGGLDRKEAMRRVARERGVSRRDVYQEVLREARGPAAGPGAAG
jgi:16S rRNA (cytidine1402-2'-O)-methyltransferase